MIHSVIYIWISLNVKQMGELINCTPEEQNMIKEPKKTSNEKSHHLQDSTNDSVVQGKQKK